ncbi:uncharacterized protein [Misgurnus anguillicaudatus]|uniref:uncharacterized protein n=1 Tax=Misgurnus anguillicaudatus TaxID=75329 RepID=UPI003CCF5EA8
MQQLENQLLQKNKNTELENLKKLMNEKERLLNDTVKELEASKHQLETLRKRIRNLASKLNVLVVLHQTFDPEKTVPDSSRCVNRTDILTVDCLYYEDTGLLECQRNHDAMDKVVNWLKGQGEKMGVNVSLRQRGLWYISAGKTINSDKKFIETLKKAIPNMKDASTVDESDIVVVFCPIVSRAGTDIEAALKQFADFTASEKKLKVLVVLHHTFDKEKTVPESSRCVNRTDILTVDCLFYEDTGLLECQKNQDAMDKVVNWLKDQGAKRRVFQKQKKSTFSFSRDGGSKRKNSKASSVDSQSSSSIGNHYVKLFVKGDQQNIYLHRYFLPALSELGQISRLSMVSTEQECDVILHIYPDSFKSDCVAPLKECDKTEKLLVLALLHPTRDTNFVSDSSFGNRPNTILVNFAISEGDELICNPDLPVVLEWLSTKLGQSIHEEGSQQHQMTDNKQHKNLMPLKPINSNTENVFKCTIL